MKAKPTPKHPKRKAAGEPKVRSSALLAGSDTETPKLPEAKDNLLKQIAKTSQRSGHQAKKLIFDVKSGELVVDTAGTPSSEKNIVVDQIYDTGFFAAC